MKGFKPLRALGLALGLALFAVDANAQGRGRLAPIRGVLRYEVQEIRGLPREVDRAFQTVVRLEGVRHVLNLRPHSIRADGFRALVPREGRLVPVEIGAPRTVIGEVDGFEGSLVIGSLLPDGLALTIELPEGPAYEIQPESHLVEGARRSTRHVTFRIEDAYHDQPYSCGTTEAMRPPGWSEPEEPPIQAVTGNVVCDLACDADFEFYGLNGSSVEATVFDIEDICHRTGNIYDREVNIVYEITTVVVRDNAADPYTTSNAGSLLSQFRSEWANNPDLGSNVRRDLAELFTGRDLDGSTIGVAWLGVVCNGPGGLPYSVVQSRFTGSKALRICLTAHELGHNWNAGHCDGNGDCGIMCSGINGCPNGCNQFGALSQNRINSHKNSRGCLTTEQDPLLAGLIDEFPSTTLNVLNWEYDDGADVNTNASNEISSPNALDLNALGSGPYLDDDIRTNKIDLSSASEGSVGYYVQHVGVENGEELVVDYWADNFRWVELDRVTSDGVDETTFSYRTVALPADALHDGFRLRFRPEVNATNDHWYLDNVAAGTFRDLSVQSSPTGVAVTVTPNDNHSESDDTTPFVREYNEGASVTLTVPATHSGLDFFDWLLDGMEQGSGTSFVFAVPGDATATAVYKEIFSLSIDASPLVNVPITVSPIDTNGMGSGSTPFARSFFDEEIVTLTAPAQHEGWKLHRWVVDGIPQAVGETTAMVAIDQALGAVAEYVATHKTGPVQGP